MPNYTNFQEYCEHNVRSGNSYASRFLKPRENSLKLALEEAIKTNLPQELIEKVEERGMLDGSFELTYEGAERILKKIEESLEKRGKLEGKSYLKFTSRLDPIRDSDLITAAHFCFNPEVRERVGGDFSRLYKIVLNAGVNRKKGYALPERQKRNPVSGTNFFPLHLRDLLSALPKLETSEDEQYQRMMKIFINKKAERDVFPVFKHGERAAMKTLEMLTSNETDENIREAYTVLRDNYRNYLNLALIGVNQNFIDPETGEKNVLPSLHQKIGIYHLLKDSRFGIWDGGGTGKTAIAILAQPLIEAELKKQGRDFKKVIVVCPNLAKKAWRKGLLGNERERYLAEQQNAIVIDADKKDDKFLESLDEKKWIVANYEQLTTNVNGGEKLFIDSLVEKGVDYVIFDESHNIKTLRENTLKGRPSHSAAARVLSLNSEYFAPMSATPISNGLIDFAVQYHLLNPRALPDPEKFLELIQNSPRILYTFFNEKSVRRTAEDINENLDWSEKEHELTLDPIQRKIYNHIIEFRAEYWLPQARKSLVDPRLVDPRILKRAGVLGQVSWRNSAKYRKLEQLITSPEGPVARNEKFVVFSTMFREGVTEKGHQGLRESYKKMNLMNEYKKLELDKTLDVILKEALENNFKKKFEIGVLDGTINVQEREKVVDGLNNGLAGIICTTETGGESMDFTSANWVYFLDEDYVPDTEEQALWRVLRKGQKKKVYVNHLRARDALDIENRDYVDKKRIIAKMAMDGVPPTEEEWSLLSDTEGERFGELVKRTVGGVSINVYDTKIHDLMDFEIKKRIKGTKTFSILNPGIYETTDAQKVNAMIGQDPLGCWMNPEFVELYMKTLPNLSPHVNNIARVCDLIARAKRKEINFPRKILAEASGPSMLYNAYQQLNHLIKSQGFKIPYIIDRDISPLMLEKANNPNKVLGCMTGKNSQFKNNYFDMIDNGSISLLKNSEEVHKCLLEDNRILKPRGLLELVVKGMRFQDSFYSGLEKLGFEMISEKNQGFSLSRDAFRKLRKIHGEHFAESYSAKLADTYFILGRKIDAPGKVNPEDFWFKTLGEDKSEEKEREKEQIRDPRESGSIINIKTRKRGRNVRQEKDSSKISKTFTPKREVIVDSSGVVRDVKKINEEE